MIKRPQGTFGAMLLATAIVVGAFAGVAVAGNGHGNGNSGNGNSGNSNSASDPTAPPASAPGNSASAPGQEKKSGPADGATQPVVAPAPPGQAKKSSVPVQSAAAGAPGAPGVKPSSSTGKNTDAPAGSTRTKLYGNGKTAGQIAIQSGYPPSGNLHGPGNSQPHKAVPCGRRHGVDVHALKSHAGRGSCAHDPGSPPVTPSGCAEACGTSSPESSPSTSAAARPVGSKAASRGASRRPAGVRGSAASAGGALGAVASVGRGELPFTGFPVWAAVLAALVLVGAGLTIRQRAGVSSQRS